MSRGFNICQKSIRRPFLMMADAFSFWWMENRSYDKKTLFTSIKEGVPPVRFYPRCRKIGIRLSFSAHISNNMSGYVRDDDGRVVYSAKKYYGANEKY